jgi:hypothetical protein
MWVGVYVAVRIPEKRANCFPCSGDSYRRGDDTRDFDMDVNQSKHNLLFKFLLLLHPDLIQETCFVGQQD